MIGAAMGTPMYMAPEQELAADSVGPEADLYSLAAILYELLVGIPPRGRWEMPSEASPGLPASLDEFMRHALQPRPGLRYQNAREFGLALDEALATPAGSAPSDAPAPVPPPPNPPPTSQPRSRRPSREPAAPASRPRTTLRPPPVAAPPPIVATPPAPARRAVPRPFGPAKMTTLVLLNLLCLGAGYALLGIVYPLVASGLASTFGSASRTAVLGISVPLAGSVTVLGMIVVGFTAVPGFRTRSAATLALLHGAAFLSVVPLALALGSRTGGVGFLAALAVALLVTTLGEIVAGVRRSA